MRYTRWGGSPNGDKSYVQMFSSSSGVATTSNYLSTTSACSCTASACDCDEGRTLEYTYTNDAGPRTLYLTVGSNADGNQFTVPWCRI